MTDFRWTLREHTAAAHKRVDMAIGAFSDRSSYIRYLKGLLCFRRPIECQLAQLDRSGVLADLPITELADDIALDLTDLDADLPKTEASDIEVSGESLLGVLYVLEGSALGARVLLKRAEALGLSSEFGARHLAKAAQGTGWLALLDLMGKVPLADRERATAASLATFDLAHAAFSRSA